MREIKFRVWNKRAKRMIYDSGLAIKGTKIIEEFGFNVMQFTGLKDKNGKEIYEGDILRFSNMTYSVKWEFTSFKFFDEKGRSCFFDEFGDTEVIGNIYENSELRKQDAINTEGEQ